MKIAKKLLAVLLAVVLIAAAFAGCSASGKNSGGSTSGKVAILQYMPHSSLDNCTQGVKNALDSAGIEYDVQVLSLIHI